MERAMTSLKITTIGNSIGIILPKEVLQMLRVSKGDVIHVTEAPGGGVMLTPYDPNFAAIMDAAEVVMSEDREALRQLAK
jgi:putative addiction module antidote